MWGSCGLNSHVIDTPSKASFSYSKLVISSKKSYDADFLVLRSGLIPGVVLRDEPSGFRSGDAGVLVILVGESFVTRDGEA